MASIAAAIVALARAFPAIEEIFKLAVVLYSNHEKSEMKAEDREAVSRIFPLKDQRPVEEIINPTGAGKPTGYPGEKIRPRKPQK